MRLADLRRALEGVPGMELIELRQEPGDGVSLDAIAEVRLGNRRFRLAINWKRSLDLRYLDGLAGHLKRRVSAAAPVLAASYVAPAVRRELERRGIGWLDAFGNLHLDSGGRLIHIERPVPRGSAPRAKRLAFGSTAGRVVQALLEKPDHDFRLEELRRASLITSPSTVSRALSTLREKGLIERSKQGWRPNDPVHLLNAWLEAKQSAAKPAFAGFFTSETYSAILEKLGGWFFADQMTLLLTGTAAAEMLAPLLPPDTIDLYLFPPRLVSKFAEKEMGWIPSEKLAKVRIHLSTDEGPKVGACRHGRYQLVGKAQLLLDLSREGGRALQVVEALQKKWRLL